MTQEFDTDFTKEIICPYCGDEYEDSHEMTSDDECGEYECDCGKIFGWSSHREVHYSTNKVPCANKEAEHDYWLFHEYKDGDKFYKCRNCRIKKIDKIMVEVKDETD